MVSKSANAEKRPISDLTYKVLAFGEIEPFDSNETIDWATEMVALGHESPSLLMLAASSKPSHYFELAHYVQQSLVELGYEPKTGLSASESFAGFYVNKMAKGQQVRTHLKELYQQCLQTEGSGLRDVVEDFIDLYLTWQDLDTKNHNYSLNWEFATRESIEGIVIEEAKKWMKKADLSNLNQTTML